jgi:hypothetical protein
MPRRTLTCLALALTIFALGNVEATACGWSGCGYAAPGYGYYAPPVYYAPRPFYPPYVYLAHPSYAYDPRSVGYLYGQPYAGGYYGGRRGYAGAPYYGPRGGYVSRAYYGGRGVYTRAAYYRRRGLYTRAGYYRGRRD